MARAKKTRQVERVRAGARPAPRFTTWAFSRWRDYRTCPLQAKLRHLERLPEPEGPALARGGAIHREAEAYLKAGGKLPESLVLLTGEFAKLRKVKATSEVNLAFDDAWRPVTYFDPRVWVRMKVDAIARSLRKVIDFKTGRYRPEEDTNELQLDLYATGVLTESELPEVTPELWYTDQGLIVGPESGEPYLREDLQKLQRAWEERVSPMLADQRFAPLPGPQCRWCAWAKSKKGPCAYG